MDAPPPGAVQPAPTPVSRSLLNDPIFRQLVSQRSSFAWTLSILMLAIYLAFVFLAAFGKPLMATTPFGGVTSLGIILGLLVIIIAFVLTGIYVRRANSVFDPLAEDIRRKTR